MGAHASLSEQLLPASCLGSRKSLHNERLDLSLLEEVEQGDHILVNQRGKPRSLSGLRHCEKTLRLGHVARRGVKRPFDGTLVVSPRAMRQAQRSIEGLGCGGMYSAKDLLQLL